MIRYRTARPGHLAQLVRVYQAAMPGQLTRNVMKEHLRDALERDATVCVVAHDDGKIKGFCLGTRTAYPGKTSIYCDTFAVDPDVQGRGIGTGIFQEFIVIARNKGYTHVSGTFTDASIGIAQRCLGTRTRTPRYVCGIPLYDLASML